MIHVIDQLPISFLARAKVRRNLNRLRVKASCKTRESNTSLVVWLAIRHKAKEPIGTFAELQFVQDDCEASLGRHVVEFIIT